MTDTQEDDPGYGDEIKLATLDLISTSDNKNWTPSVADGDGFWKSSGNIYTVKPWKTTAGNQKMALILNKGSITTSIGAAPTQVYGTDNPKTDIAGLTASAGFTMTSATASITVTANVTESTAKTGTGPSENVFSSDVERVVAKGIVRKGTSLTGTTIDTSDGKGSISLSGATDLTFSAVNGATKTYLFADKAGARQLATADPNEYTGFESVIHSIAPQATASGAQTAGLIRLGNISTSLGSLGGYEAQPVVAHTVIVENANKIYFMENSGDVTVDAIGGANKVQGFYRFAYAKVYATYTPKKIYELVDPGDADQGVHEVDYLSSGQKADDGTFYKGASDHLLYVSKAAAAASPLASGQGTYTYTKGRCGYRAL